QLERVAVDVVVLIFVVLFFELLDQKRELLVRDLTDVGAGIDPCQPRHGTESAHSVGPWSTGGRATRRCVSRTADVVIVGAGVAGCATAWALRERGVRVVLLERETELGRHASGRGAGLGRQLAEDDDTTRLTIRGAATLRDRFADAWTPCGGILTFDDA